MKTTNSQTHTPKLRRIESVITAPKVIAAMQYRVMVRSYEGRRMLCLRRAIGYPSTIWIGSPCPRLEKAARHFARRLNARQEN